MCSWLLRATARADLSGLTETARTGTTLAGGTPRITLGRTRWPVGALAPSSIHNLMRASSVGVRISSPTGGMNGLWVRAGLMTSIGSGALSLPWLAQARGAADSAASRLLDNRMRMSLAFVICPLSFVLCRLSLVDASGNGPGTNDE